MVASRENDNLRMQLAALTIERDELATRLKRLEGLAAMVKIGTQVAKIGHDSIGKEVVLCDHLGEAAAYATLAALPSSTWQPDGMLVTTTIPEDCIAINNIKPIPTSKAQVAARNIKQATTVRDYGWYPTYSLADMKQIHHGGRVIGDHGMIVKMSNAKFISLVGPAVSVLHNQTTISPMRAGGHQLHGHHCQLSH